ncbi:MAG TPA: SH3 domain-containing protein [Candidatus Cybelea sp.]|nr:SH3 domain-containing protein [Candidatus Cybelea sp.]
MQKIAPLALALVTTSMLIGTAQAASPQAPAPVTAGTTVETAADVTMIVAHSYAHLRKESNTKSPILATLKQGTKVDVIEKVANGKWAHVKSGKLEGYIAVSLLKAA